MTYNKVKSEAENFCIENDINEAPVEIIRVCNELGIKVFETYLKENISGLIVVDNKVWEEYNSDKFILVNLAEPATRRRFTIAHELAHYVLHREDGLLYKHRDMNDGSGNKDRIEKEADYFASNILMPEKLIREHIKYVRDHSFGKLPGFIIAKDIADMFAVSESAAEVRLRQLGLY